MASDRNCNLLTPHQSAYCKHHSTETALAYIHDHLILINAIGSQKISCLCLLDLSAAFDTIDNNILINRLSSWFGIHGPVLNRFKSYLSSRSFRVQCSNNLSSSRTSSCGVPQGSVLGPILFIMYIHPTKTTNLVSIAQPSPVCRRHTAFLLFLFTRSSLQHLQAPDCLTRNLFLDDC